MAAVESASQGEGVPQNRSDDRKFCCAVLKRTALGAALGALLVCANTAAVLAGDDDSDESFLSKFERTLGLKNQNTMQYEIDYNERSPLVVPPTRDLPPPQAAAAPAIPDWPKDSDIRKRQEAKKRKQETRSEDWIADGRPLSPGELDRGTGPGAAGGSDSKDVPDSRYPSSDAKKSLFNFNWFKKEEYATFTGEPARTSLTEPPPGYLTPSPDQPYGVGPDKKKAHVETPGEHGQLTR